MTTTLAERRTPQRIQRHRTKGWRKPDGAVCVGRPGRFGNPFPATYFGAEQATQLFREWLDGAPHLGLPDADRMRQRILDGLPDLAGKTLACWCRLPEPGQPDHCHAAVLLHLANPTSEGDA